MGDRGNICVHFDKDKEVYLYTHWEGSEIKEILHRALSSEIGKNRWDDPAYLTRIIFCEMVGEKNFRGETGFGISTFICDNEYPILHIYPDDKKIREIKENGEILDEWSFQEFIARPQDAPESKSTGQ